MYKFVIFTAIRWKEFFLFSTIARFSYLLVLCALLGLLAPAFLYDPEGKLEEEHIVSGTCHVEVGVRTNCLPDIPPSL
jgi:hypothetical protein